jgi:RND superfamily putative drug exporter
MIARLGRWTFQHRRTTLIAWLVALVGFGALGNVIVGPSFSSAFEIPASESASGFDVMSEFFPQQGASRQSGSIVFRAEQGVADPAVRAAMTEFFGEVGTIEGVTVLGPYDEGGQRQIDPSGTIAFATVNLDDSLDQVELSDIGAAIGDLVPAVDGVTVEVGGRALAEFEPPQSELIGLGFAIIVLILAFGSVLAMGLPIGVALFGVGVGASVVALFSNLVTIPDFATTLGAMIGIAVGIDYALFIVTRYRENLKKGQSFEEATVNAMDTAGRAVVFAGVTVVVSLLGMLLIGLEFISGLGIGAATTVAVTMIASITLLPALLGFAGPRIEITRWRGIVAAGFVALTLFGARLVDRPAADRGAVGRRDVACGVRRCPAASRIAGAQGEAATGDVSVSVEPRRSSAPVAVVARRHGGIARPCGAGGVASTRVLGRGQLQRGDHHPPRL